MNVEEVCTRGGRAYCHVFNSYLNKWVPVTWKRSGKRYVLQANGDKKQNKVHGKTAIQKSKLI